MRWASKLAVAVLKCIPRLQSQMEKFLNYLLFCIIQNLDLFLQELGNV